VDADAVFSNASAFICSKGIVFLSAATLSLAVFARISKIVSAIAAPLALLPT
jgi:hypothetical protein